MRSLETSDMKPLVATGDSIQRRNSTVCVTEESGTNMDRSLLVAKFGYSRQLLP